MKNWIPESIIRLFPEPLLERVEPVLCAVENLTEIRIRADAPMICVAQKAESVMDTVWISGEELNDLFLHICRYSVYAYEEELRKGYLTAVGGHRIGVCGHAVMDDRGNILTYRYVTSMNIRIAHEIRGAADEVLPYLCEGGCYHNTLIVSAPGCGKTTLLRDLIRCLSDGSPYLQGRRVAVIDERMELGAMREGHLQNDLGIRTDVLCDCPKAEGIRMLIRTMAPKIIAVDEVGSADEAEALYCADRAGCGILATVHGDCMEKIRSASEYRMITGHLIERYVLLSARTGPGTLEAIYDGEGKRCFASLP